MKKVVSISLLLIIMIGLLSACQESKTNTEKNHQFSNITVIREPESYDLKYLYGLFEENYDSYQEALDELVNRYNQTHDNEDLFRICMAVSYGDYIENADELIIEYYYQFFETIWTDQDFRKEKSEYEEGMARRLVGCMYLNGDKKESLEFYDKYIASLQDTDTIIFFSVCYVSYYKDDKTPDYNLITAMYDRAKNLEKNYYYEANEFYEIGILGMISDLAEMLGDTSTAEIYKEKIKELYQKYENETSDE